MTVPASVPSLFQSSFPLTPSLAPKYNAPEKKKRSSGPEPLEPGQMSLTMTVPASVPSLFQSSPPFVPSFAWYLQDRISKSLGLEYSLETARMAMSRRKQELSQAMADLIAVCDEMTRDERMGKIKRDRKKVRRK